MSRTFFITGSGTGVGKTLVAASLAHQLLGVGKTVSALKPVISGYVEKDPASDSAQLLASQNLPLNVPNVEAISPWRFAAPLAPAVAASREGREIDFAALCRFCTTPRVSEITLIEGAGGVMAPLTASHTTLDWMEALACPAILVVGTYLGALSHALTAGAALSARGIAVQAVVVSESAESAMEMPETARLLKSFMPTAKFIVPLPRIAGDGHLWQHAADMTWMLT